MASNQNYDELSKEISTLFGGREVKCLGPSTSTNMTIRQSGGAFDTTERFVDFTVEVGDAATLRLVRYINESFGPFMRESSHPERTGTHCPHPEAYLNNGPTVLLKFPEADIDVCMDNLRKNTVGIINNIANSLILSASSRSR